ncbi:thylakoid membrane protein slr0575 [Phtheirospermum japonicum]|uniref:Thylakoid membrane protein slr0575 n=1 Tax=Phtheirospermum japonicum TaxID=374723 RepID=A0A830B9Q5_9LAMI|nr:thylakoid membrane protein slr0575 [Phtheirospermum japonicum]
MKSAAAMAGGGIITRSPTFSCTCLLSLKRFSFVSSGTLGPNSSSVIAANNRGPFLPKTLVKGRSLRLRLVRGAAESTQSSSVPAGSTADKPTVPDNEFSLAKVSFGVIGLGVGVMLLSYGFGAYFNILPGSEWSAIMLTYGFPLAIIGMALKYAELKPVPCLTYSDAESLREKCATPILKQVRNDVTRYRYGDEQHLDEALKRIFQYGQGGGIPRRSAPILQKIREEVTEDGRYSLVLVFEAKALELSDFEQRKAKFASFFGPGITAEIGKSCNLFSLMNILKKKDDCKNYP